MRQVRTPAVPDAATGPAPIPDNAKWERVRRDLVDRIEHLNAPIIIDQKRVGGGSRSTVGTYTDIAVLLRLLPIVEVCLL